jgi:iron complex transport system substrate-binding protein
MSSLGFVAPPVFDEMAGEEYGATVSTEQLNLIADLDALIWVASEATFADLTIYQALPVVTEGRALYFGQDDPVYDALNFGTVLSLPFAIERVEPQIAAAIDGNPATRTED